jgi:hypothetical protein
MGPNSCLLGYDDALSTLEAMHTQILFGAAHGLSVAKQHPRLDLDQVTPTASTLQHYVRLCGLEALAYLLAGSRFAGGD